VRQALPVPQGQQGRRGRSHMSPLQRFIEGVEMHVTGVVQRFLNLRAPSRRQRMQHSAEIRQVLGELQDRIPKEAPSLVKQEYNNAARAASNIIPDPSAFPVATNFSQINRDAVGLLSTNLTHSLQDATATVGRRTDDILRRHGLHTATAAAIRNLPLGLQAGELQRRLEREGLTSFVDKAGRKWQLSTYSDMVIRTTTVEAQSLSVYNLMLGRDLDLVRWANAARHPCPICDPYVEQGVWSLMGKTEGYPKLDKLAPIHPNCRCSILPARENFIGVRARAAA
jgi:hypothetical protein